MFNPVSLLNAPQDAGGRPIAKGSSKPRFGPSSSSPNTAVNMGPFPLPESSAFLLPEQRSRQYRAALAFALALDRVAPPFKGRTALDGPVVNDHNVPEISADRLEIPLLPDEVRCAFWDDGRVDPIPTLIPTCALPQMMADDDLKPLLEDYQFGIKQNQLAYKARLPAHLQEAAAVAAVACSETADDAKEAEAEAKETAPESTEAAGREESDAGREKSLAEQVEKEREAQMAAAAALVSMARGEE